MREVFTVFSDKPFPQSKGVYTRAHVDRLERIVDKYVTDGKLTVIESEWPGWWGKIELFKHKEVFYMDLSVAVLRNIDHLVDDKGVFRACKDFVFPHLMNSKVMSWSGDYSHVYKKFAEMPACWQAVYSHGAEKWGDQSFISDNIPVKRFFDQGEIISYKRDTISDKTSILAFHGKPKPEETEYWKV